MNGGRRADALVTAVLAASVATACSSSSGGGAGPATTTASTSPSVTTSPSSSAPASSPTSTAASTPTSQAADVARIKAAWTEFFAGTTPAARKQALLQNGHAFAALLAAQAQSSMARSTSVTVSRVQLPRTDVAKVTYTILLSGKPALPNQIGIAVRSAGRWRVSASSFCGLLALEGQQPAVCKNLPPVVGG